MPALKESSPEPSGQGRQRLFIHRGLRLLSEAWERQAGPREVPGPVLLLSWVIEVPGEDAQPWQGLRKQSVQLGSLWQCSTEGHRERGNVPAVSDGLGRGWLHPRG